VDIFWNVKSQQKKIDFKVPLTELVDNEHGNENIEEYE